MFTVSRHLDAPPEGVFTAFADTTIRRRWLRLPGRQTAYDHEFRIGGGESSRSTFTTMDAAAEELEYRSRYIELTPNRRLVFGYESTVNGVLCWTSLVPVQPRSQGSGTRLEWTEQAAFLTRTGDGSADLPHLRGTTVLRLNGLDAVLAACS